MSFSVPQSIYNEAHRLRVAEKALSPRIDPIYSPDDIENKALYKWAIDYLEPLKIRMVMKDRHEFDPDLSRRNLVYYDMFDAENNDTSKNNVAMRTLNISNNNTAAGVFAFKLEDSERNIDIKKVGHNNIVIIQGRKLETQPWQNMMFGICRKDEHEIYGSVGHNIIFSGFGTGVIANETVLDFKRIAQRSGIESTAPYRQDPAMYAPQLALDVFTAEDVYPERVSAKNPNLKNRGFFDTSGINLNLREFVAGLSAPLVIATRVLNDIAALIGANWWVDEGNVVRFDFLSNRPSGIVLKNKPKSTDNPDLVSYFFNSWGISRSTNVSDGFANKLWSTVDVIDVQASGGSATGGNVPLFNKDLAQQLPAGISFKDIAMLLQRNGNGTSDPLTIQTLHGHIVKDKLNTPTGTVVALFDIALKSIPVARPTPIFIPNLQIRNGVTIGSAEKTWIIIYDRGNNLDHTLLWFKDNGTEGVNAVRSVSQRGAGGDHNSGTGWTVNQDSFTFAYAAFDRSIQRVNAYDPFSIHYYGLVEQPVTVPLANDPSTVDKYLHQMLLYTAKPKLTFNNALVTIPNLLLKPRINLYIQDERITFANNRQLIAENNAVEYSFDASRDASGIRTCSISPSGLFDHRSHYYKRATKIFKCKR